MHPIPEKGKIQPYPNSPDEDEHLAFTAVNTQNELEYRWTHVSIVVTGLRWWNTVSVYHRLWLPSASSPMGLPRIRHIRRSSCWIVEEVLEHILSGSGYWRTLPRNSLSSLPFGEGRVLAHLLPFFRKITIYDTRTFVPHRMTRPIYSTSLEHRSSSIKIKRGIATRVIQDPIGLYCSRQQWDGMQMPRRS